MKTELVVEDEISFLDCEVAFEPLKQSTYTDSKY